MVLDPRNGPSWDLPLFVGTPRPYVVASVPRCGSTLLCRLLWDTGLAGAPKEYLNPMQVRDWEARMGSTAAVRVRHRLLTGPLVPLAGRGPWSHARLEAYLARVQAHRTGPNGVFGLKLHHHHHHHWFVSRGWDLEAMLGPARWVHMRREDRVAQAVSWERALQTGRWASYQRERRAPRYVRARVATRLAAIQAGEAAWQAWFAARGVRPLEVTYEALVADRQATVRRVLAGLGIEGAADAVVPEPEIARQADAVNAAWVERFRAGR